VTNRNDRRPAADPHRAAGSRPPADRLVAGLWCISRPTRCRARSSAVDAKLEQVA